MNFSVLLMQTQSGKSIKCMGHKNNMKLDWSKLLSVSKGNFYLINGRERDIDIFNGRIPSETGDVVSRILRGKRCKTKNGLIQEFAAALQFPYYAVNDSWDGFNDCIIDMDWLPAEKYFLFITNFDEVLSDNPEDLRTFFIILKDAIIQWTRENRNNIPTQKPAAFNILFHCDPENEELCLRVLTNERIKPEVQVLHPFDDIK